MSSGVLRVCTFRPGTVDRFIHLFLRHAAREQGQEKESMGVRSVLWLRNRGIAAQCLKRRHPGIGLQSKTANVAGKQIRG